jgi:hypothetical protein
MKFVIVSIAAVFAAPEVTGIVFSRTVNSLSHATAVINIASGCTGSDAFGSNDCAFPYGSANSAKYDVELKEDITSGTFTGDLKVNSVLPLNIDCAICGKNCTFVVPIIKKSVTFAMPDCPIKASIYKNTTAFTLPAKNPIGVATTIAVPLLYILHDPVSVTDTHRDQGTVTMTDQNGNNAGETSNP